MSLGVAATAAAGGATLAAYLNAKFHIAKDIKALHVVRKGIRSYEQAAAQRRGNLWFVFLQTVKKYPDMVCLWTREGVYTYREVQNLAYQYAHFFLAKGVQKGDLVAFYLQNRMEFICAWLGLWSIGCAPAAINYNLAGDALLHCLKTSGAKLVLVDDDGECLMRIEECKESLKGQLGMELMYLGPSLVSHLSTFPTTRPPKDLALDMAAQYPAILLYTSGTTGMPKGCAFTMSRFYTSLNTLRGSMENIEGPGGDIWYSCMPLYHGTSAFAMMSRLVAGIGIAVGKKFSVRNFWSDIRDSGATTFVYVGEVARYLLAAPPSADDRNHRIRCMYGNGLRPDIWERFRERFGIADVSEFFNSTEGIFGLFNYNKGPFTAGIVGHHGLIMRAVMHNMFVPVAIDPDTGDVLRDPQTGFAIRTSYDKGGEILVSLPSEQTFQGYWRNNDATSKKFLRDVFKRGDLWYRSGDALRRADDGRWYFLDRLGDTFRWKSENVATAEVAEVLGQHPSIQEANVYGVLIPHHEGRAGCAALELIPQSQPQSQSSGSGSGSSSGPHTPALHGLAAFARARLPKYAVPVFLRIVTASTHIHNHKQSKVPLREEGVDPEKVGTKAQEGAADRFFWLPPGAEEYVEFGREEWEEVRTGRARL